MTDAWQSAKIKQFEHVLVGSAGALLRISATAPRRKSTTEPRPTLVADDGHVVRRFAPIPSPADKRGVLRAAYSVSADVLKPETVFSLELPDGYVISLPALTSGAPRLTPGHEDVVEPPAQADVVEATPEVQDDRRSEVSAKLAELSAALAEAERSGAEHQAARATAEADADAARDEARELGERLATLESASAETEQRLMTNLAETETENEHWAARFSELETWRGELERRLTETVSELDVARTRLREDERELADMREQLADAQARAELVHAELVGLQGRLSDVGALDADARERIRQLESDRQEQARHAAQLADLLQSAEQLAERLCAAAGPVTETESGADPGAERDLEADPGAEREAEAEAEAEAEGALETDPEAGIELDAIVRRAEIEAAERAATELAAAAAEARLRH